MTSHRSTSIFSLLLLSLLLSTSLLSKAQTSDLGNWLIYFGNKQINPKLNLHHEVQYRNYNAIGDMEQLLLRTGLGYNLTEKNNNILLGYGFIASNNYDNNDSVTSTQEHRIYQQFITKQKIGNISVQHRYRFEQRFVDDADLKLRGRYFVNVNVPITNKTLEDNTLYFSSYNEIFIGDKLSFDRNRLYGGLGYKLNKSLKCELGYMNQFFGNGNGRDQINLMVFASF